MYKNLNFSTIFLCENLAAEDFVTLPMGKKSRTKILNLPSTNAQLLGRLYYRGGGDCFKTTALYARVQHADTHNPPLSRTNARLKAPFHSMALNFTVSMKAPMLPIPLDNEMLRGRRVRYTTAEVVLLLGSSCEGAAAVHYFQIYLTFLGGSTIKPHRETRRVKR